jgi:hypothetical protein
VEEDGEYDDEGNEPEEESDVQVRQLKSETITSTRASENTVVDCYQVQLGQVIHISCVDPRNGLKVMAPTDEPDKYGYVDEPSPNTSRCRPSPKALYKQRLQALLQALRWLRCCQMALQPLEYLVVKCQKAHPVCREREQKAV